MEGTNMSKYFEPITFESLSEDDKQFLKHRNNHGSIIVRKFKKGGLLILPLDDSTLKTQSQENYGSSLTLRLPEKEEKFHRLKGKDYLFLPKGTVQKYLG